MGNGRSDVARKVIFSVQIVGDVHEVLLHGAGLPFGAHTGGKHLFQRHLQKPRTETSESGQVDALGCGYGASRLALGEQRSGPVLSHVVSQRRAMEAQARDVIASCQPSSAPCCHRGIVDLAIDPDCASGVVGREQGEKYTSIPSD